MITVTRPSTNPFLFIQDRIDEKVKEKYEYQLSVTTKHTDEYQRRDGKDYHKDHRDFYSDERWEGGESYHENVGDPYVWYEH